MTKDNCVQGATNTQRIKSLEERVKIVEQAITDMRDGLLSRPSWFITVIITILSSITFASLTYALTIMRITALQ